jgi:hypothetical protein
MPEAPGSNEIRYLPDEAILSIPVEWAKLPVGAGGSFR